MHQYNLRPVAVPSPDHPHRPDTYNSYDSTPPPAHLPPIQHPSPSAPAAHHPRPISPSNLPNLDVSAHPPAPRNYPPPPTGHELMRLFPPPPPDRYSLLKPGPTSIYFYNQERAFFALPGKEVVRLRIDSDFEHPSRSPYSPQYHSMPPPPPPSQQQQQPQHSQSHQQQQQQSAQMHPQQPPYPLRSHPDAMPPPPPPHPHSQQRGMHSPPGYPHMAMHDAPPPPNDRRADEATGEPDEAWRRPMPYAERRRAGKHTKRVVVKA